MEKSVKVLSIISTVFCGIISVGSLILCLVCGLMINEMGDLSGLAGIVSAMIYIVIGFFLIAFVMFLVPMILGIVAPVRYSKTRDINKFKAEAIVKIIMGSIGSLFMIFALCSSEVEVFTVLVTLFNISIPVIAIVELVNISKQNKIDTTPTNYGYYQ